MAFQGQARALPVLGRAWASLRHCAQLRARYKALWPKADDARELPFVANAQVRIIVAGQAAITLTLLIGTGLLGRSMLRVLSVHPGFETQHVVALDLQLPPTT